MSIVQGGLSSSPNFEWAFEESSCSADIKVLILEGRKGMIENYEMLLSVTLKYLSNKFGYLSEKFWSLGGLRGCKKSPCRCLVCVIFDHSLSIYTVVSIWLND